MRNFLIGAAATLMAATAALAHHEGDIFPVGDLVVSHAWTYATAEAGHSTKVYLTIENGGAEADRLIDASVSFAPRIVMQAQAVDAEGTLAVPDLKAIRIEPGQVLTLQPGAIWLELEGVQASFVDGQYFHMDLTFEQAGTVEIDVGVNAPEDHEAEPAS